MEAMDKLYLGIDIGGSAIKYGWGNQHQGLMSFQKIKLIQANKSNLINAIDQILKEVDSAIGLEAVQAIGVGTPGTMNKKSKKIIGVNPNLSDWADLDPREIFPDFLKNNIVVENDANLMTLAESYTLPEHNYVLGITIGSGIGCGFVINRQIYQGANGYAMELGHNIVKLNGAQCNCGKMGCLEAYASVNGMLNLAKSIDPQNSKLKDLKDILETSDEYPIVNKIINEAIDYLALAISNLAINLDVDTIVIGGGAVEAEKYPTQTLLERIHSFLPDLLKEGVTIKQAEYSNKAGVLGAILLAKYGFSHD